LSIPYIQAEIDGELSNLIQVKNRFPVGISARTKARQSI